MAESGVKAGRAIMSFIFAPVGIITYFMIRDERPQNAKAYLGISIVSIALSVGSGIYWKIMDSNKSKAIVPPPLYKRV